MDAVVGARNDCPRAFDLVTVPGGAVPTAAVEVELAVEEAAEVALDAEDVTVVELDTVLDADEAPDGVIDDAMELGVFDCAVAEVRMRAQQRADASFANMAMYVFGRFLSKEGGGCR